MDLAGMYGSGNGMIVMFGLRPGREAGGGVLADGVDEGGKREVHRRDLGKRAGSSRGSKEEKAKDWRMANCALRFGWSGGLEGRQKT